MKLLCSLWRSSTKPLNTRGYAIAPNVGKKHHTRSTCRATVSILHARTLATGTSAVMSRSTPPSKRRLYAIWLIAVFDAWLLIGLFCRYVLKLEWQDALLAFYFGWIITSFYVAWKISNVK